MGLADEPIQGTFYASELQRMLKDEKTIWKFDKVLTQSFRERTTLETNRLEKQQQCDF